MRKIFLLLTLCSGTLFAQKKLTLSSPDGRIRFTLEMQEQGPAYGVRFIGQPIIAHSSLGLSFDNQGSFGKGWTAGAARFRDGMEDYTLAAGKTSAVHESYKEMTIPFRQREGTKRTIELQVRVFNDGLGFRYLFPVQAGWTDLTLMEEHSDFNFSGNPLGRVALLPDFLSSHEHRYTVKPLLEIPADSLMDMPALFEFGGDRPMEKKVFVAITEANLVDYAGMSLIRHQGVLTSRLSPLPGQQGIKVKALLPHQSPWRVLMISDRVGALIESNLLTNLSAPCAVKDLTWLKPGKASFHWWNGDIMPDTTFEAGVNFNFSKYYIDFCARNGIEYHTIIGYRGVAWYQNDGIEYQPGPHTDITKPRPGLDIPAICNYARSKGVGIRFWVHWQALYPKLDTALALFEKWGISGMMVDFMDRDDQEMVRMQEEILQKAAAHHLEIQFHGAFKPTGLSRTYPNESTREGALNYENNKWGNLITPDDDIEIPFTRGLAGPTDYHLGGFRAMPAARYQQLFTRPHMLGTRCHMLAMYIVLENHLAMVCDYPEAYEGQDGFDFLREVPTVRDETRVLDAVTGQYVVIARRKGTRWYIGAITNGKARDIEIPLSWLPAGEYQAGIYADAPDVAETPDHLVKEVRTVRATDRLTLHLAAGGGQVIKLQR